MAFIISGGNVLSFAEYQDVLDTDQRLFEENEGLTDEVVEDALIKATNRILTQLKDTAWYKSLAFSKGASALTIPNLEAGKIIARKSEFTELCTYYALYSYILPRIADFGTEENAERVKINFYQGKYSALFDELLAAGDWYDYNGNGSLTTDEYKPRAVNYQRVR